jgi:hypothetical protein
MKGDSLLRGDDFDGCNSVVVVVVLAASVHR